MKREHLHRIAWAALLMLGLMLACRLPTPPPLTPSALPPTPPPTSPLPTPPLSPLATPPISPLATPPPPPTARLDAHVNPQAMPPRAPIILHFSEPMAADRFPAPLQITPQAPGTTTWDEEGRVLIFVPDGLTPGLIYHLTLPPTLTSRDGRPLVQPYTWQLRVPPAPVVTVRRYLDGDRVLNTFRDVSTLLPTIQLTLNQPMDEASVAKHLRITPPVPYTLTVHTTAITIEIARPLALNTLYTFELDRKARSIYGIPMRESHTWAIHTLPLLASVSPSPHLEAGREPTLLTLRFNYPLDIARLHTTARLTPPLAAHFVHPDPANPRLVTLVADAPPPTYADVTLTFTDSLRDIHGLAYPPPPSIHFTTPPPLRDHTPRGRAVHPALPIRLTFDRAVDRASVEAAFRLSPAATGTLTWTGKTLTFLPASGYLTPATTYTVTITPDALDAEGHLLFHRPYTWQFTTRPAESLLSFGDGLNIQLVDIDGRRTIPFVRRGTLPVTPTLTLHRLTPEQFIARYLALLRYDRDRPIRTLPLTDTTLTKQWTLPLGERYIGGSGGTLRRTLPGSDVDAPDAAGLGPETLTIPDDVPPGLYILSLRLGYPNDQLLLILTRDTLMLKQAGDDYLAWLSTMEGEAVSRAEVRFYARDGRQLRRAFTDADGLARATLPDAAPLLIIARHDEMVTVCGVDKSWSTLWEPWSWRPRHLPPPPRRYTVHLYTDRPLYRPGHTVHFKAIVRRDDDARLTLPPADLPVTLRLRDARRNIVRTLTLTPNPFGTLHGDFELADGATTGDYTIELDIDGEITTHTFGVEAYRKPDYRLIVTPTTQTVIQGRPLTLTIRAAYNFGPPVAGAKLTLRRYTQEPSWIAWGIPGTSRRSTWFLQQEHPLPGVTQADGTYTLTLPIDTDAAEPGEIPTWHQRTLGLEILADDGSHQKVSTFAVVHISNTAERVTLNVGDYFQRVGHPIPMTARVEDVRTGQPVPGRRVTFILVGQDTPTTISTTATTDAGGWASATLTASLPGPFQLRAEITDRLGRAVAHVRSLYLLTAGETTAWGSGREGNLQISADADRYAPGDTAHLLITTDEAGPALLTVERGSPRRARLIHLTPPFTLIDLPILADDVPNIHVTVSRWAETEPPPARAYVTQPDRQLLQASTTLHVPADDRRLTLTLTLDRESYAPRDVATVTVRVRDTLSRPVVAELSLALVDEALFTLRRDATPSIFDTFYAPRPNAVRTFHAMAPRRILELWGGGGGGGEAYSSAHPRSHFPDTALWLPALRTDANGEAVIPIPLPDTLTRWRLTVKAVTAQGTRVGEARHTIAVRRSLVIRPLLPRLLTAGDTVTLTASLHNGDRVTHTLAVALVTDARLHLRGTRPSTRTLTLPPGTSALLRWPVEAVEDGESTVLIRALEDDRLLDAIRLPLPIRPLAAPTLTARVGTLRREAVITLTAPAIPRRVTVELNRSIADSLLDGLAYLTDYPYGCVEQTMSRALPNAVVGRAFHRLGLQTPGRHDDLAPKIAAGLQRLYGFQHRDGGWGWWYDDTTDAYQTAWVLFGLVTTAEAGYEVDPNVIARGAAWLRGHLSDVPPRTRAYALYSLAVAGAPHTAAAWALRNDAAAMESLDAFGLAALILAFHRAGEGEAADALTDLLIGQAAVGGGLAYWPGSDYDGHYARKTIASEVRSTALALEAILTVRPRSPLIPQIVRWLMLRRKDHGWGSTNETAYAILALTDYLVATGYRPDGETIPYTVVVNGTLAVTGTLEAEQRSARLTIPADLLRSGDNILRLTGGAQTLYYVVTAHLHATQEMTEAEGLIAVQRLYRDPTTRQPITGPLEIGSLVEVALTFDLPTPGTHLVVEDPLPGGLEGLNERLNPLSYDAFAPDGEPARRWPRYGYNFKEVLDDRVRFFITEAPAGKITLTYYARVLHGGQFTVPPAEVWGMYTPGFWGRSAIDRLEVREQGESIANR